MYKIDVHGSVYEKVRTFGIVYRAAFIERFTDTGLGFAEEIIQKQYIESAEILVSSIIQGIRSAGTSEFIYHTPLESGLRETSFRLGNRRIFLTYEEDEVNMIRYITDIEILRK